jgi:hypothetical protein
MKHLHRNVILAGLIAAAIVAVAYAVLGIGFAVIVAVGLFVCGAVLLAGLIVFEEETRLPWWADERDPDHDHGYHPAR